MITPEYIRGLLETINERRYNLQREREWLIDSESEIIEALSLPAPTFSTKVQAPKTETITSILARIPIEIRKQKYEMSFTAALNDAKVEELRRLMYAIKRLDDRTRCVIYIRYFDRLTIDETAVRLGCYEKTVRRRTAAGIQEIVRMFNKHGVQPIDGERAERESEEER